MSESGALILIVEDDKRLSYGNRRALESEGYEVRAACTLAEARAMLASISPDVILLDVKLPDGSGFDLCREIRGSTTSYIIFLTSVRESAGEMEGLVAGGDDYLRKPYSIALLRERVRNAIARGRKTAQFIKQGSLTLDTVAARAYIGGTDMNLTPKEFALLHHFLQNENQVMSAEHLYEKIWGQPMNNDTQAIRKTISCLRGKLDGSGLAIDFEWGEGYHMSGEE